MSHKSSLFSACSCVYHTRTHTHTHTQCTVVVLTVINLNQTNTDNPLPILTTLYQSWQPFTNHDNPLPILTTLYQSWQPFTNPDNPFPHTQYCMKRMSQITVARVTFWRSVGVSIIFAHQDHSRRISLDWWLQEHPVCEREGRGGGGVAYVDNEAVWY